MFSKFAIDGAYLVSHLLSDPSLFAILGAFHGPFPSLPFSDHQ